LRAEADEHHIKNKVQITEKLMHTGFLSPGKMKEEEEEASGSDLVYREILLALILSF
jgi:hypothetical protein